MKWAWIENDIIRDVCQGGNPSECYHPDVAKFYDTTVPDDAFNGMIKIDGNWQFPPLPEPEETSNDGAAPNVIG
jgi:hypothetical protein